MFQKIIELSLDWPNWFLELFPSIIKTNSVLFPRGANLGFSWGVRIFKKFSKILSTFFLGRPNWSFELSLSIVSPFWLNYLRRRQKFEKKKQFKTGVFWALFGKCWPKNRFFSAPAPPSKLVYVGAQGALRKILGSVGQKWSSYRVKKKGRTLWVGRGSNPWGGGGRTLSPPPLNPPLVSYMLIPLADINIFQKKTLKTIHLE